MPDITIELDGATTGTNVDSLEKLEQVIEAADRLNDDGPPGAPNPESVIGALVPIVLFVAVAAVFCAKYYFAHRNRRDAQATVRAAIERGESLNPELLERLVEPHAARKGSDLRRGVIWVGLGLGIGAFGFILGEEDAVRPMLAVGLVPLLLGLAYLVLWRLSGESLRN